MMKRAARHRKRIAPPGPCGVLWQTQRVSRSRGDDHPRATTNDEESALGVGEEENESLDIFPNGNESSKGYRCRDRNHGFGGALASRKKKKTKGNGNSNGNSNGEEDHDASTPPAWTAMQRSLGIVTPYLPVHTLGDVPKRYELLRPHLPPNCLLLSDVLRGEHDLKLEDPDLYLFAWVDSIDERNAHHGIWTILLKDETGATIRAWMEPNFCKKELQKAQQQPQQQQQRQQQQQDTIDPENALPSTSNTGVVRTGVVWMLQNFSLTAIHHQNGNSNRSRQYNHNGGVERMLVVSGKHIARVWTPEKDRAQNEPNEEDDSPEAQRGYLDWMEKRKALVVEDEEEDEDGEGDGEDEEGEGDDRSRQIEYCENNTDHRRSEMDEHDRPGEERRECGNTFSAGHQQLADCNSHRCKTVRKSPPRIERQRKNEGSVNGNGNGNGGCGDDDQECQRGNPRIVGGTPDQERMTALSALTMTANEDITQATQTTTTNNNNNNNVTASVHTRAVAGSPLETQPLSPLAHRDVNIEEESNNCANTAVRKACADAVLTASARNRPALLNPNNSRQTRNHDDGGKPSLPRLARKSAKGPREQIPETSDPGQSDTEIATQPDFAKQNKIDEMHTNPSHNETNNHRKEERRKMITKSGSDRTAKREGKKNKKDRFHHHDDDDVSPCGTVNDQPQGRDGLDGAVRNPKKIKCSTSLVRDKSIRPQRNRGDRSPIRSPIRLARSVWNTPDPSILEMLREEEAIETQKEEEEVKTLIWESSCPSCSCLTSKTHLDGAKVAWIEESKSNGLEQSEITMDRHSQVNFEKSDYNRGNESPIAEQMLLSGGTGGALFQLSSWVGVDMGAFSEEEMDDES